MEVYREVCSIPFDRGSDAADSLHTYSVTDSVTYPVGFLLAIRVAVAITIPI